MGLALCLLPGAPSASGQDGSQAESVGHEFDLPKAASGAKQIELVDQLYPETGDQGLRRQALERALTYFPDDDATSFRLGIRLAVIDWNAGRPLAAHKRLETLLSEGPELIGLEIYSWAEILDGRVLADLGQPAAALKVLDRVALDKSLPNERRTEAASASADIRAAKSPQAALDWLEEAASRGGLSGPSLDASVSRLLLLTGNVDELEQRISDISSDSSRGEVRLAAILDLARGWRSPGDSTRMNALVSAVMKIRPSPGAELQKAIARCRATSTTLSIGGRLATMLAAKPLSDWYHPMTSDAQTSLDEFERSIEQAVRKSDPGRCLRLSLRALASHGADDTFFRRIWEAAGYADWVERSKPEAIDERVCPLLLDLCDQFPPSNPYFVEGKFLRAERLARRGDTAGQRAVLTDILAVPGLSANYLSPACKKLGASLESASEYRQAIEVYAQAEPIVDTHSAAAECVLRAAWINLGLGNNLEAERLIKVLSGAPANVTRQMKGASQFAELETLVKIGRAKECWTAGRTWWAEWAKIAVALGAPTDLPEYAVPEIDDVPALEEAIRGSAQANDRPSYIRHLSVLMAAARWQPSLCPEAAALCASAVKSVPASSDDLRGFLIRMLASPHPPEIAGLRERKLCLAVNYLDVHQYAEVLRVASDFESVKQADDNTTMAMHRVRAIAALAAGSELAASAADLEADLADPGVSLQRAMTVGLLSDIYRKLDRPADAVALLQREIGNPAVVGDEQGLAALRMRLTNQGGPAIRPPDVVQWVKSSKLGWYDYAEPKSLDDPRLANLEDAIENADLNFAPAEKAKLLLLAAGDSRRSPEDRNRSFLEASSSIIGWASDYGRLEGLAATIVNDPSFDQQTRLGLLWKILTVLARDARKADFHQWRGNDLCGEFSPEFKARLGWLDREVDLDRTSPAEILKLAHALAAQDLTASGALVMQDCFDFLLRIGAAEQAATLEREAQSWTFSSEASPSAGAVRMEFAREVRIAAALNPVHEALASAALVEFPDVPESLPIDYINLRIESHVPVRSTDATFKACQRLIADRRFERNDLQFWGTFLQTVPSGNARAAGNLVRAGLEAAPNDGIRSQLIVLFFSSLDVDDPAVRAALEQEFARYRQPTSSPLSYMMIRLYEIHRDLRLGKPAELETAFLDLNDSRVKIVKERACLRYYTQTRDREQLQRTVDQIDPAQLLSPGFLVQSVPALQFLGREADLKAAREATAKLLQEDVLQSWACGDESAGENAIDLALALGDRTALPRGWVYGMGSTTGNPVFQERVLLTEAYLESDWAQVERRASSLTREFPSRYSAYWYQGLALHHLGRDGEAAKALAPYLDHAKDELEYPNAVDLAKTLPATPPGT